MTTDTMQNMMAKLKVFADERNETYYRVGVECYSFKGIEVSVYINGISFVATGKTIDEAIQKLREYASPTKYDPILSDVTF